MPCWPGKCCGLGQGCKPFSCLFRALSPDERFPSGALSTTAPLCKPRESASTVQNCCEHGMR